MTNIGAVSTVSGAKKLITPERNALALAISGVFWRTLPGPALLRARKKMRTTRVTPRGRTRERGLSMEEMKECGQGTRRELIS